MYGSISGGTKNYTLVDAKQTLYCKETKASPGFAKDSTVYTFYKTNSTYTKNGVAYPVYRAGKSSSDLKVYETPLSDPISVLLQKEDAVTGEKKTDGSLQGAEFKVCYYAGNASSIGNTVGVTPTRTWTFKTDSSGAVRLLNSYKLSGDDLYTDADGRVVIPYGFITIQETKAPDGYQINNKIYFTNINSTTDSEDLDWRTSNKVIDTGVLDVPETPNNGGLVIEKYSEDGVVADVWFSVYKGKDKTGTLVGTYKTDSNGIITNSELDKLTQGAYYTVVERGFKDKNGNFYIPSKRYGEVGE